MSSTCSRAHTYTPTHMCRCTSCMNKCIGTCTNTKRNEQYRGGLIELGPGRCQGQGGNLEEFSRGACLFHKKVADGYK